ncbi:MAG: hypothetical protein V9G12_19980 [Microthrixaceae bacterium]
MGRAGHLGEDLARSADLAEGPDLDAGLLAAGAVTGDDEGAVALHEQFVAIGRPGEGRALSGDQHRRAGRRIDDDGPSRLHREGDLAAVVGRHRAVRPATNRLDRMDGAGVDVVQRLDRLAVDGGREHCEPGALRRLNPSCRPFALERDDRRVVGVVDAGLGAIAGQTDDHQDRLVIGVGQLES